MIRRATSAFALAVLLLTAGCGEPSAKTDLASPDDPASSHKKPRLGLMTSLPLYWPLGSEFEALASGDATVPWQREALEAEYELVLLDTLSPIAGLTPDAPETDPLNGIDRLAIIQPRGLSPADNVALDEWVQAGGHLLLMLDPMLTGHYDLPLGSPGRPVDSALIPPVVARWGLAMSYVPSRGEIHTHSVTIDEGASPVIEAGILTDTGSDLSDCSINKDKVAAVCSVGKGRVNLIADAAVFEHPDFHLGGPANIAQTLSLAFD